MTKIVVLFVNCNRRMFIEFIFTLRFLALLSQIGVHFC